MFWEESFLENTALKWLIALVAATATFLVVWIVRNLLIKRLGRLSLITKTVVDDMIVEMLKKTKLPLMAILALYKRFEKEEIEFAFPTQTVYIRDSMKSAGTEVPDRRTANPAPAKKFDPLPAKKKTAKKARWKNKRA